MILTQENYVLLIAAENSVMKWVCPFAASQTGKVHNRFPSLDQSISFRYYHVSLP